MIEMKILVTGGNGYIGSHTCVELLNNGYEVVILDNFSNSKRENLSKIKQITGKDFTFYEGNMIDEDILDKIFTENKIDAVIDFAAYKAVGESVEKPVEYYTNNVSTVLVLLSAMKKYNVKKLVFSSSATVYGDPEVLPITEDCKTGNTTNPYGTSKLFVEQILKDLYKSDNTFDIAILRYFNPIGAHSSGLIGEEPNGIPANLLPYVSKVASGKLECLSVFGNDYDTKDGTGVRDYIHVVDLAIGHIKALEKLNKEGKGLFIYNLATGTGYSVLDIINTFEKVNNVKVNYKIVNRRPGDIAACYSDPTKAKEELGFVATKTLEDMCRDLWNYEKNN
ncbi:UDP-glucose 4-epimerase [human gut metagenome]|uniref:UDP-glucose 4-epimerase n=1 Tax=human gut metagenome TaxID=408170 RepID=K1SMH2_9ZZZZ